MIAPAAFLALLLALGYVASREHVKRRDAEATADDWIASHAALEEKHRRALESREAWRTSYEKIEQAETFWRGKAADLDRLLTAELARTEIHETAHACLPTLDGIAANGVLRPVGVVVDDEPTWTGLVRDTAGIAPVVPLRGLSADEADDLWDGAK